MSTIPDATDTGELLGRRASASESPADGVRGRSPREMKELAS